MKQQTNLLLYINSQLSAHQSVLVSMSLKVNKNQWKSAKVNGSQLQMFEEILFIDHFFLNNVQKK